MYTPYVWVVTCQTTTDYAFWYRFTACLPLFLLRLALPLPVLCVLTGQKLQLVTLIINPRRAHAQRGLQYLVCHSVRPSVCPSCYHVFWHYAQQGGQKAIPTGSVPHWLDFKKGDFRKSTAFKSYGVKTKRTSQYANEHDLPRPDSARFSSTMEAVEVTRRASMWSWFAKNTTLVLPT